MINKICACEWGINVFRDGIYPYRARNILRKLYRSASNGMKRGSNNTNSNDGDSLYRICISIRINEFMRKCGNNKSIIGNTIYRGRYSRMSMRRIQCRKPNIE